MIYDADADAAERDKLSQIGEWLDPFANGASTYHGAIEKTPSYFFEDWGPVILGFLFVLGDALVQIYG
jgi:hypothetical protein